MPKVSIIVPTFNRATLLTRTISSLLDQDADDYEILVIDDGSTDATPEVMSSFVSDMCRYYRFENRERGAARNAGAVLSNGDYLNFFDSDDIALRNHVSSAINLIEANANPTWFHLNFLRRTGAGDLVGIHLNTAEKNSSILLDGNPLSCNGVFIRKDVFLAEKFCEDRRLAGSEDYDLWLRLILINPLLLHPLPTTVICEHSGRSVNVDAPARAFEKIALLRSRVSNFLSNAAIGEPMYNRVLAGIDAHLALHVSSFSEFKGLACRHLFRAIRLFPRTLLTRRFCVVVRNLFLRW